MTRHLLVTILVAMIVSYGTYQITSHNNGHVFAKRESAYDRVLRTGTLRCGYAMWPPNVLAKDANTGKLNGAMVDIVEQLAKNLSLKVEWTEETGWGSWPEGLNSGRFDMFCASGYETAARGRTVRFTSPIFYDAAYPYVRADDTRFDNGLDKLNDPQFKISTMDGEISAQIAEKAFPKAKLVSLPQMAEFDQLLLNVTSGKADIVFNEPMVVDDFIKKNPGLLKRASKEPYEIFSDVFSVGIEESNLQSMIDSALLEMQNNGQVEQILKKYNITEQQFLRVAKPYKQGDAR